MKRVKGVLARVNAAADLTEKAASDVLKITSAIQEALMALPESSERAHCLNEVSKLFEVCTFEDLAKQHLEKVAMWLREIEKQIPADIDFSSSLDDSESLLRGPALEGEESVSQAQVDQMLSKRQS